MGAPAVVNGVVDRTKCYVYENTEWVVHTQMWLVHSMRCMCMCEACSTHGQMGMRAFKARMDRWAAQPMHARMRACVQSTAHAGTCA